MLIGSGAFATDELLTSSPLAVVYFVILTVILGAVFGSFINCMAWRIAHDEKVTKGRSHCAVCGHTLSALDLIPIVSYVALRGRCRYCGEKISPRYVAAEIVMALGFVACFLRYGISVDTLRAMGVCCIVMALSLVDLETYIIPDRFIAALIVLWGVTVPFVHGGTMLLPFSGETISSRLWAGLVGGVVLAGALLILALIMDKVTGKESLGGGDIKLLFAAGLYLGLAGGILCMILSSFIGLIFVVGLKKERIPFGPSISIAIFLCLMFGDAIIRWYSNFFV